MSYADMSVEIVTNHRTGDLIARTTETHRNIAFAHTGTAPHGDSINPEFLRLKAAAYLALAEHLEDQAAATLTKPALVLTVYPPRKDTPA